MAKLQRKLIFEGDSLSNWAVNHTLINGRYVTSTVYSSFLGMTHYPFPISGQTQSQINTAMDSRVIPIIRKGDILVLYAGTNDLGTDGISAASLYTLTTTYSNAVRNAGAKLVLCTLTSRDHPSDAADVMTRLDAFNVLLRNNASSICDVLCDLYADPMFDTRADCSNATNYYSDKLHFLQPAQNQVASLMVTAINTIL